jgi:glycosyltransferase involved in cell wall biosynthesis
MRRVLMVSPHFPPDSSAASHRVRLLAPHLPAAGWSPTVLTVQPSAYEGRLDARLAALVPPSVRVERAEAWPAAITRRAGLGDLGLRAFTGLHRACRSLLARERFDALFITIYPTYPALLGPLLKRRFSIPFVLDYQDPWVGAWGRSVGGGGGGGPDWKSRGSRQIGAWLEPRVLAAASGLVAVSQGTIDGIVERIPSAASVPHDVIPLGFDAADFAHLDARAGGAAAFDPRDGLVHLCYVGTLLPTGIETLRLLLRGLDRARREDPNASRLRLHFVGTSNQSESTVHRVRPIAQECGVADVVSETPGRVDYLDALAMLTQASGILLLGSSEPHYTASKLYPALIAKRPLLALFHEASSVVSILRTIGCEPTVRIATYGGTPSAADVIAAVACHFRRVSADPTYHASDVSLDKLAEFSAAALARRLGALLDRVAA